MSWLSDPVAEMHNDASGRDQDPGSSQGYVQIAGCYFHTFHVTMVQIMATKRRRRHWSYWILIIARFVAGISDVVKGEPQDLSRALSSHVMNLLMHASRQIS